MRYKLEKLGCYVLIIILLPYIVTVFMNGPLVAFQKETMTVIVNEKDSKEEYIAVPLDEYGISVLAREIPANYEKEALKAQAIIVRTRIYKYLSENGDDAVMKDEFWTKSDIEDFWGTAKFASYFHKLESAWKETEGQVLVYEDGLIHTPFFSLSNGSTRDGKEVLGKDYPYLKIKDCPLDIEAVEQIQTVTLSDEEAENLDIEILSFDKAGYVLKVRIGKNEVSGEEFRQNYNLASSCFSIHEYEGNLRITTRGVGHGIGLSQNTANIMAKKGNTAEEILEYFYEGCEQKEVADFV